MLPAQLCHRDLDRLRDLDRGECGRRDRSANPDSCSLKYPPTQRVVGEGELGDPPRAPWTGAPRRGHVPIRGLGGDA